MASRGTASHVYLALFQQSNDRVALQMEDGLHTAAPSQPTQGGSLGWQDGPLPLGPADQA